MGKFNLVVFHSHLGAMQMTAQSSMEKQSEESGRGKLGLRCHLFLSVSVCLLGYYMNWLNTQISKEGDPHCANVALCSSECHFCWRDCQGL